MVVAIIRAEKANELKGQEFQEGINFNPVQLNDGRWFISFPEAQYLSASDVVGLYDFEITESEI